MPAPMNEEEHADLQKRLEQVIKDLGQTVWYIPKCQACGGILSQMFASKKTQVCMKCNREYTVVIARINP